MATRSLADARGAFEAGNADASARAHGAVGTVGINTDSAEDSPLLGRLKADEKHRTGLSEYIQAIIFGGLDGIITTFAVVAAGVAGNLERKTILTIGFANLVGDAFAMAVGDYLSSRAELDHANSERAREAWEIEHDPDTEKKEMVEIYVDKGLSHADAVKVVDLLFTNEDAFLNIMMMEELGIMPQDASVVPWKSAVITFVSFILFGGFPMLAYICAADYNKKADLDEIFGIAVGLLALALFGLGAYKGQVIQVPWWQSGLSMLIVGGLTTVAAYFIGDGLSSLA